MAIQSRGTDQVQLIGAQRDFILDTRQPDRAVSGKSSISAPIGVALSTQVGLYSQSTAFDYQVTVKFSGLLKTPEATQHARRVEFLAAILHWMDESQLDSDQSGFSFDQFMQVRQILESELSQTQVWLSKARGSDGQ